jgi:hypothetical protein
LGLYSGVLRSSELRGPILHEAVPTEEVFVWFLDLSAIGAAGMGLSQAKMGVAPQAEKIWWPSDKLRGRGRESRAKPEAGTIRPRTSPRSACSAFCLLAAAGQPKMGAAPQAEKIWWPMRS